MLDVLYFTQSVVYLSFPRVNRTQKDDVIYLVGFWSMLEKLWNLEASLWAVSIELAFDVLNNEF
jgi:hypothetical protein